MGHEIPSILIDFNICPNQVIDVLSGASTIHLHHLITCPINIDTIDGITRTIAYFDPFAKQVSPEETLRVIIYPSRSTEHLGDAFWQRKHQAYNEYINRPEWAALDDLVTMALVNSGSVSPDDFLLSDFAFYMKFSKELERAQKTRHNSSPPIRSRHFVVNWDHHLGSISDLSERYIEVRYNHDPLRSPAEHKGRDDIHKRENGVAEKTTKRPRVR